mmetsp:Transcript_8245/g.13472  ORF Transcript_8245/g.13472 Transcript_8245/m.13472 type:complete len:205 (+) Transcript_8245:79-693(+)|eukprot:CAMPEP_0197032752 /NCGR_PEP_ID=MMETSP1384-20130603/11346_1 /TAXON_ID=29189 /ORGANISM="Ammonia sp." /LENGTH=204 /DNA_ID=CAMNT_0042462455 /DNA_START=77 /DNA_END=691 /DNA_ORIENTATION=+
MADGIKLIIVGDGVVGKTCLMISYISNEFPSQYIPTIFENKTVEKTVTLRGGKESEISLDLWDTAGQDQYDRLRILAYPNTNIILLCFSTVDIDSLTNIETKWYPEINHHIPSALIMLVGTKCDLKNDPDNLAKLKEQGKEPVPIEKINAMKDKINAVGFIECSALKQENVDLVFNTAIQEFLEPSKGGNSSSGGGGDGCCILL